MSGKVEQRLEELGIALPPAAKPAANYLPFVTVGNTVYVSGQIPHDGKDLIVGKLGDTMEVLAGQNAAKICALFLLAQAKVACGGDLDRITEVVKLTGFVNSAPDFNDQHLVINGASDVLYQIFKGILPSDGKHARAAVGNASLPLGVAVEVEGIFQIA